MKKDLLQFYKDLANFAGLKYDSEHVSKALQASRKSRHAKSVQAFRDLYFMTYEFSSDQKISHWLKTMLMTGNDVFIRTIAKLGVVKWTTAQYLDDLDDYIAKIKQDCKDGLCDFWDTYCCEDDDGPSDGHECDPWAQRRQKQAVENGAIAWKFVNAKGKWITTIRGDNFFEDRMWRALALAIVRGVDIHNECSH